MKIMVFPSLKPLSSMPLCTLYVIYHRSKLMVTLKLNNTIESDLRHIGEVAHRGDNKHIFYYSLPKTNELSRVKNE